MIKEIFVVIKMIVMIPVFSALFLIMLIMSCLLAFSVTVERQW